MKEEKMQNLRKAAQQALEALEKHGHAYFKHEEQYNKAIMALHFALCDSLEPVTTCHELSKEGDKLSLPFNHFPDATKMVATIRPGVTVEPVAWMVYTLDGQSAFVTDNPAGLTPEHRALPLYTAPPKRKPLTDEQIESMWEADNTNDEDCRSLYYFKVVARAIERAHGIRGKE